MSQARLTTPLSRRQFISTTALACAGVAAPTIIRASALGKGGAVAPGNRITVGVIGTGSRGLGVMNGFLQEKTCQVVAVCDVKSDQLLKARSSVNQHYQNEDCRTYSDFRELTAREDIDAVLIGSPDHWHVLHALAAVNAGKDVYVEKPLGLSLEEGQTLRKAVRRKQRVFQFGTQQRSARSFRIACEFARNGVLGRLQHINVWAPGSSPGGSTRVVPVPEGWDYDRWLGPAAFRPHTENLCVETGNKTWWFVSDFALGFIAGWGIHPMDIALWGGGPLFESVISVEGRGNFRSAEGTCDTATIWDVDFQFEQSGLTLKFVGVPNGENQGKQTGEPWLYQQEWSARYGDLMSHGTVFEGTEGWAHVNRGTLKFQPESFEDRMLDDFPIPLTRSPAHVRNFLECVKSREETVSPVDSAVKSDALCHIADIAIRLGRKLRFDFRTERFIGDASANDRPKARPMREPWRV